MGPRLHRSGSCPRCRTDGEGSYQAYPHVRRTHEAAHRASEVSQASHPRVLRSHSGWYDEQMDRLEKQIQFIIEIDKLKSIYRRTYLIDGERKENTAEHSWHLAMLAMVLAEYANEPVNVERVVRM